MKWLLTSPSQPGHCGSRFGLEGCLVPRALHGPGQHPQAAHDLPRIFPLNQPQI